KQSGTVSTLVRSAPTSALLREHPTSAPHPVAHSNGEDVRLETADRGRGSRFVRHGSAPSPKVRGGGAAGPSLSASSMMSTTPVVFPSHETLGITRPAASASADGRVPSLPPHHQATDAKDAA